MSVIDKMEEALDFAGRWFWNPDEGTIEQYERIGEWFTQETGLMRPGKSYPMEGPPPPEDLERIFREWCVQKSRQAHALIRSARQHTEVSP